MNSPSPKEIVSNICDIGSLPQSLASILKIMDDPDSEVNKIAEVISRDVSLTARVLKMVNSAHYNRSRKVTKISEAITVIGLNSIKMLTLSSTVFGMIPDKGLLEKCDLKRIWRHLIETAINAKNIAEEVSYRESEEAFIAGVLHDIGIILLLMHFKGDYLDIIEKMKEDKCGLIAAEREAFGFTHCDLGAEMIEIWKLPSKLVYVIQNHHTTGGLCIVEDDSTLNDIVMLADRLTAGPFDEYFPDVEENIKSIYNTQKKLNLSSEATNKIRKKSTCQALMLAEYLDLDVGEIKSLLAEANERMAGLYFSLEKMYIEKQNISRAVSEEKYETVT
jgi:putative nucleotidyltransferase with HDIG domain